MVTVIIIYSVRANSPVTFPSITSCNSIHIVKNAASLHTAVSPFLKMRPAADSTAESDSQTIPSATLSAMRNTGRKPKNKSPWRKRNNVAKLAYFDF